MPTRNVVITDEQQSMVDALVASGRYQNASEVLRAGLRMVEEYELLQAEKLRLPRAAAHAGFADVAAGHFIEIANEAEEHDFWAAVDAEVDARLMPNDA